MQYCVFITLLVISGEGPAWINPLISGQLLIIRILNIGSLQAFRKEQQKSHFPVCKQKQKRQSFFLNYIFQ